MFDRFKKSKPYHNMGAPKRKKIVDWCKTWDDDKCQGCNTPFETLEKEAQIKEELSGKKRILPIFVVGHRDGDSSHDDAEIQISEDEVKWHPFGNCFRICHRCNRFQAIRDNNLSSGMNKMTQERHDRLKKEDAYIKKVMMIIEQRQHVCYKSMAKAGKSIVNSSEITCVRYQDTVIRTPENPTAPLRLFPYSCGGKFCNGDHICYWGIKPDVVIEQERKILEDEWSADYIGDDERAVATFENLNRFNEKQWISKEEYISKRLKMNWDSE